jgi:dihydrofolate reductase
MIGILMIKGSVFVGTSLDGFITRLDGSLDFLEPAGNVPHGYEEFIASVDTLVWGRNTYETVLSFGDWPYKEKPVFVLSSGDIQPPPEGVVIEHLNGRPTDIASQIADRGFKHMYVDGGVTIRRFLRAGLIQRLIISRVPVLIGEGLPLFGDLDHDIALRHVATHTYPTGLVQSEYEISGQ